MYYVMPQCYDSLPCYIPRTRAMIILFMACCYAPLPNGISHIQMKDNVVYIAGLVGSIIAVYIQFHISTLMMYNAVK